MSKDPANLEKALAKKARKAERKAQEKARKVRIETFHTGEVNISQAADWKLLGCWVNDDWDNYQSLNHLIIARQNGAGIIAAGVFLIDLVSRSCQRTESLTHCRKAKWSQAVTARPELNL